MILEIKDLKFEYGSGFKLKDVSFNLRDGETLIVKGQNGSGKTTLVRAIVGLLPIKMGMIALDELDITNDFVQKSEYFSFLGHLNGLNENLTVMQNLKYWFGIFGENQTKILEDFQITTIKNKKISDCSSGQKRMVGLARIFNCPKKILVLDEPFIGLDLKNKKLIYKKIAEHKRQGGITIIVSHENMKSDKTLVMQYEPTSISSNSKLEVRCPVKLKD